MKVMVCSNVEGLSQEKIQQNRERVSENIKEVLGNEEEDLTIIFDTIPGQRGPLNALGRSLEKMADADAVYFDDGYSKCRNGIIAYTAARLYNKKIIRE